MSERASGNGRDPAIEAALRTAAALTGMEVVFVNRIDDDTLAIAEMVGEFPGVRPGGRFSRADTFCHLMLSGAPPATADAPADPVYRTAPVGTALGITSYVGVPIRNAAGDVVGTLCCLDRGSVDVDDAVIGVLEELASIVAGHLPGVNAPDVVVRRTSSGWRVDEPGAHDTECSSLTEAMTLADLLAADVEPPARPPRTNDELDETARLRVTVSQLEHALAARVVVEQAIGVLVERLETSPRAAFERLRKAARCRGRRVHDLAREVVESASDRSVPLPPELHGLHH